MINFWFSDLNEIESLHFFDMLLAWLLFALEIWLWCGVVDFSSLKTRIKRSGVGVAWNPFSATSCTIIKIPYFSGQMQKSSVRPSKRSWRRNVSFPLNQPLPPDSCFCNVYFWNSPLNKVNNGGFFVCLKMLDVWRIGFI